MSVTKLRNSPPVTDIPGQLRQMADWIEKGEEPATSVLFLINRNLDYPKIFGWGEHLGDHGNVAVCELAKLWFCQNLTVRNSGD